MTDLSKPETAREIERLKRRARELYHLVDYHSADVSCGNALLGHIRPAFASAKAEFDDVMAKLKRLDPTCP